MICTKYDYDVRNNYLMFLKSLKLYEYNNFTSRGKYYHTLNTQSQNLRNNIVNPLKI